ncbi:MAG: hypothetical protein RL612_712 [Actinomycetota bacterium]|jgi:hypothetical protein
MEIAFLVVYAAILGLVAPYVGLKSDKYGSLVPSVASFLAGAVLWTILTWVGMSHTDGWIWIIVMLAMPAALWFGPRRLEALRSK